MLTYTYFSEQNTKPPSPHRQHRTHREEVSSLLSGKTAVIVEDEGITQMQLRRILSQSGVRVTASASTGAEGVAAVLRERPEFVLMDINMPGPFNGLEAARRILADYSVCIIMLTAYPDYEQEAQELGACGYVLKPVTAYSLIPQIIAVLEKWEQS
jgi:CheY-like chemotaxis protein